MKSLVWTLAFVVGYAAWASPPPPPGPGPIGWEKRIAPGFDPPIEYVIVYGTGWIGPDATLRDVAAKWGGGAIKVLGAMYADEEWKEYHEPILSTIALIDAKESTEFLEAQYKDVLSRSNPKPADKSELSRLLSLLRARDPERANQLVDEGLKDMASPHFDTFVYDLTNRYTASRDAQLKAKLDDVLQTLPEGNLLRKSIADRLEGERSLQRADEPMDAILAKEKGGKS